MKIDGRGLQLKKRKSQLPPKISFRAKAAKYLGICGLALLTSCNAYSRLPQTVRDEVAQCHVKASEYKGKRLHHCLKKIAIEESTVVAAKEKIIDYFEEMLQDSKKSVREDAMGHLNSIFWNAKTGFAERKRIVEIFGKVSRLAKHSICAWCKDMRLHGDAISNLLMIATNKELGRELNELAIASLEYPWEEDQLSDFSVEGRQEYQHRMSELEDSWEGYLKHQHRMSDLEFGERTIGVLERIIKHERGREELVALRLLAEFGKDEKAGPGMRNRIFGLLEGFWSKKEWRPDKRYHALTHIERDDCNGNILVSSLQRISLAEKKDQKLRKRMVDFLYSGWKKRECFDNPYILTLLKEIKEDEHTDSLLKIMIKTIAAEIRKDPRTKIQDDEHKAWTDKLNRDTRTRGIRGFTPPFSL